MTVADMAIRFVASNPHVDTVLMGARNVQELEQNAASIEAGPLPADVLVRLDETAAALPCRPAGEPWGMGYRLSCPNDFKGPGGLNYLRHATYRLGHSRRSPPAHADCL